MNRLTPLIAFLLFANPPSEASIAGKIKQLAVECMFRFGDADQNAKILLRISTLSEHADILEDLNELGPASPLIAKTELLEAVRNQFSVGEQKLVDAFDKMILLPNSSPLDRLAALRARIDLRHYPQLTPKPLPLDALTLLWNDFEGLEPHFQQYFLVALANTPIATADQGMTMVKLYQLFTTSSGLSRILAALNIILFRAPEASTAQLDVILPAPTNNSWMAVSSGSPAGTFKVELFSAYLRLSQTSLFSRNPSYLDIYQRLRNGGAEEAKQAAAYKPI